MGKLSRRSARRPRNRSSREPGQAKVARDALAGAIVTIARFAVDGERHIREIDVNPLIVLPPGEEAVAVDGLIVVDSQPPTSLSARTFFRER